MARHSFLLGALAAALAFAAAPAAGVPVWATWTVDNSTTATASLPDGRSATFTGFPFSGGSGGGGTVTPAVPGIPSGDRHPVATIFPNATPGLNAVPGDLYFSLDLSNWTTDADTLFGLEDVVDFGVYRLELLDAALTPVRSRRPAHLAQRIPRARARERRPAAGCGARALRPRARHRQLDALVGLTALRHRRITRAATRNAGLSVSAA
jgi:hypothetical protein